MQAKVTLTLTPEEHRLIVDAVDGFMAQINAAITNGDAADRTKLRGKLAAVDRLRRSL